MRTRQLVLSLSVILMIAVVSIGATILTGKTPLLGLDLKGGVSVVEQPQGKVTSATLQESQNVIERRVNGLGVSNSSVTVQGNDIVIELPGARNDTDVLKIVGQTAQLFFRPVECIISPYVAPTPPSTSTSTPTGTTTTTIPAGKAKVKPKTTTTVAKSAIGPVGHASPARVDARLASDVHPVAAGTSTTSNPGTTAKPGATTGTGSTPTTAAPKTSVPGKGGTTSTSTAGSPTTVSSTTVPSTTTTTSLASAICSLSTTQQESYLPPHADPTAKAPDVPGVTPSEFDTPAATVVLPDYAGYQYGRYVLGPAEMSGSIVKTATANLNSQTDEWEVDLSFTGKGSTLFNKYAAAHYQCYQTDPSNPPDCALQAIELDATVESAPAIEASSFPGGATINGSSSAPFTSAQASSLALDLNYGSLPVRFVAQNIDTISPEIGTASLRAGAIAGGIAVLLVLLYLMIYYRALGLVVVIGICMSGALLYSITTLLSQTSDLALTLSGVIGLIVSVGVTADSCVVYFERLKEEIRTGRTVRTSVEKGFGRAFRTILAADFSSFIGAFILYTLTVGDVRGFAFFLGLATLLNVVTTYFFTRPLVILLGRRASLTEGGFLGVNRGLGARPVTP